MMQIIIEEASYLSPEAAREVAEEVARTVNLYVDNKQTFTPKHCQQQHQKPRKTPPRSLSGCGG